MSKIVAIVGSDTTIGRVVAEAFPNRRILHPCSSLDWKHPLKVQRALRFGNPTVFIFCYSVTDQHSEVMLEYLRSVLAVAESLKAQVVAFSSYQVYGVSGLVDETTPPMPNEIIGQRLLNFEQRLSKHKFPLCFRLGEFYTKSRGYVTNLLKGIVLKEHRTIDDTAEFSLTSESLLKQAVAIAVERQMVETYNLANTESLTDAELFSEFRELLFKRFSISSLKGVADSGTSKCVLDTRLWSAFSMTTIEPWSMHLQETKQEIAQTLCLLR